MSPRWVPAASAWPPAAKICTARIGWFEVLPCRALLFCLDDPRWLQDGHCSLKMAPKKAPRWPKIGMVRRGWFEILPDCGLLFCLEGPKWPKGESQQPQINPKMCLCARELASYRILPFQLHLKPIVHHHSPLADSSCFISGTPGQARDHPLTINTSRPEHTKPDL